MTVRNTHWGDDPWQSSEDLWRVGNVDSRLVSDRYLRGVSPRSAAPHRSISDPYLAPGGRRPFHWWDERDGRRGRRAIKDMPDIDEPDDADVDVAPPLWRRNAALLLLGGIVAAAAYGLSPRGMDTARQLLGAIIGG